METALNARTGRYRDDTIRELSEQVLRFPVSSMQLVNYLPYPLLLNILPLRVFPSKVEGRFR